MEIFWWLVILIVFSAILLFFLFIILMRTPALVFLKSFITGRSVVYIVNRSQQARFVLSKNKYQGTLDVKRSGPYLITENSHTIESKSGMPVFLAFGEFAATLPLGWIYTINKLKNIFSKSAKPISNVEDLGERISISYDQENGIWKKTKKTPENVEIPIEPYETIKMHDLVNMFPYNITPASVESRIVHEIAAKQRLLNSLTPQNVFFILAIIIVGSIAAVILWQFFGGNAPTVKVTIDQAGKIISQNMTG